ncbi:hypothetical protein PENTCL1PPCAC_712, partial [Pristionchus entomophagus]
KMVFFTKGPHFLKVMMILIFLAIFFSVTLFPENQVNLPSKTTIRMLNFSLPLPYRQLFDSISFVVPVVIIDSRLLQSILTGKNHSEYTLDKLKIAVEKKFQGAKISENDVILEIVYYTKPRNDSDYWMFEMANEKRAMIPFELHSHSLVYLPRDINSFLEDWKNSRFMECRNIIKRNQTVHRVIPLSFIRHLAELRNFIKHRNARVMLLGGTLLGWYRECSLIPHTTDIDFGIRAKEYSPLLVSDLDADTSPYKLSRIFGMPSDSFELTVKVKDWTGIDVGIDLFFVYSS